MHGLLEFRKLWIGGIIERENKRRRIPLLFLNRTAKSHHHLLRLTSNLCLYVGALCFFYAFNKFPFDKWFSFSNFVWKELGINSFRWLSWKPYRKRDEEIKASGFFCKCIEISSFFLNFLLHFRSFSFLWPLKLSVHYLDPGLNIFRVRWPSKFFIALCLIFIFFLISEEKEKQLLFW